MTKLSSAAWVAHDLGLAAAIGGTLFAKSAFDPSLNKIRNARWRDDVNEKAWNRYGPLMMAATAAVALPWIVGRTMLSGREVSGTARSLTRAKDVLVGISVATTIASAILGRLMSRRRSSTSERGPEEARADGDSTHHKVLLDHAVDAVSTLNLAANVGIMGVTSVLAMEGSQSGRFAIASRTLP